MSVGFPYEYKGVMNHVIPDSRLGVGPSRLPDLNLPAEPERVPDLNLPAEPERDPVDPGEIDDIASRFSKKERMSMGLPKRPQQFSLEQQRDLKLRAREHLHLKVEIVELLKSRFPNDNWIQCESIRKGIFIAHYHDNEYDLGELQAIKRTLTENENPGQNSVIKELRRRLQGWHINHH
ncbi:hypothetical protein ACOSQ2_003206 [Xanthoceras sorbifolium]